MSSLEKNRYSRRRFLGQLGQAALGSAVGLAGLGGLTGCDVVPAGPGKRKDVLLFSNYQAGGADPTAAARQMIADAKKKDGLATAIFDHRGTVKLKTNLVIDFPVRILLRPEARLRQAAGSSFQAVYRSRFSGIGHTGMFMLQEGAEGSELEFYGQIDANVTGNYDSEGSKIACRPVMLVGAHNARVHGDWTFENASVGVWAVDCDHLQVRGVGSESPVPTSAEIGNGGTVLGLEGCRWVEAGGLWGKGIGEIVDLNARNRHCVIDGIEAEHVGEVVDLNNSRDVTVKNVKALNCPEVFKVYDNDGGHITQRPSVPQEKRNQITAENFDIVFDKDLRTKVGRMVFMGYQYPEGSNYRNIRFRVHGADPAKLKAERQTCGIKSHGGEIDVSYESDVAIDVGRNFEFSGRDSTVHFESHAPIARGRAAMLLNTRSDGLTVKSPRIAQVGEAITSEGRIGIDAREGGNNQVVDERIVDEHFEHEIVR